MPTWDKILQEIENCTPILILDKYIKALSECTKRTTICYMSAFSVVKPPVPPPFHSIIDQDMQGFMTCSKDCNKEGLDLIIHSPGGDYEAMKRIIDYLQSIYKNIRTFVPHMSMSGGTMIACASDEIFMGPYSSLGPTDPQILLKDRYVPMNAVIQEFETAFKEVSTDPSKALLWNERIKQIPFGQLQAMKSNLKNTVQYLNQLLKKRNCQKKTEKEISAIVEYLCNLKYDQHSSHGAGISFEKAQELGLNVKNLSREKELEDLVLSIYHAATVLFEKTIVQKIIVNNLGAKYLSQYGQR